MSEKRNKFILRVTFFLIFSKVQYSGAPGWFCALSLRLLIFAQVLISEWWMKPCKGSELNGESAGYSLSPFLCPSALK